MNYYILISDRQPHTVVAKVRAANRRVAYGIAYQNWFYDVNVPVAPGIRMDICPTLGPEHKSFTQQVVEVDKRSFDRMLCQEIMPKEVGYWIVNTDTGEIVAYIVTATIKLEAERMLESALEEGQIEDAEYTLESFDIDRHDNFEGLVWICY